MSRANLRIKVGKYTGNGVDSTSITGVGFKPDLLLIKSGAANTVFRTKEMRGDFTSFFASSNTGLTDRIQRLEDDGFQVGTAAQVNSNAAVYYYVAVKGMSSQGYFRTGNYVGDGNDDRTLNSIGLGFTPDIFFTQANSGANRAVLRTSTMTGDQSTGLDVAGSTNMIQSILSTGTGGITVGTNANVNGSTVEYFFAAMKALGGRIAVGTFVGTGTTRIIGGVGFQPDVVVVKNYATTDQGRILTSTMVSDALDSLHVGTTAGNANGITALVADGFKLGTDASVNKAGDTHHWFALKAGDFETPLNRSTA